MLVVEGKKQRSDEKKRETNAYQNRDNISRISSFDMKANNFLLCYDRNAEPFEQLKRRIAEFRFHVSRVARCNVFSRCFFLRVECFFFLRYGEQAKKCQQYVTVQIANILNEVFAKMTCTRDDIATAIARL